MRLVFKVLIITLLLTLFVFTCASAAVSTNDGRQFPASQTIQPEEETSEAKKTISILPAALQIINESAFEGTALISVELPEKLEYIGEKAFAHILSLRSVCISDKTKFIGKNAFIGSSKVTITAYANSYAWTWARNNGLPSVPIAAMTASNRALQITGLNLNKSTQDLLAGDETIQTPKGSEQNGRAEGEIKAAKHEECFAYSFQGRAPPMAR